VLVVLKAIFEISFAEFARSLFFSGYRYISDSTLR